MITPKGMQQQADKIGDIYAELDKQLLKLIIDTVNESGYKEVDPAHMIEWQIKQLANTGNLTDEAVQILSKVTKRAKSDIQSLIRTNGLQVVADVDSQLEKTLDKHVPVTDETKDMIDSFVRQTMGDINNNVNQSILSPHDQLNGVVRSFQDVLKQGTIEVTAGIKSPEKAIQGAIYRLANKGIPSALVDKSGREWSIESYARMAVKTTAYRTFNDLRMKRMNDFGLVTALMSSHPASRRACAGIQGHVVNVVPHGHPNYDERYPTIYDHGYGKAGGTQGANCSHVLTPFDPEGNTNDMPQYNADEAVENAQEQQKQRAIERAIRESKKKLYAAQELGDSGTVASMKQQIRNQQAKLRQHVADNDHLHREYGREQVPK